VATTYLIFDKAEEVELLNAEIYRLLADRFQDDPAAYAVFSKLMHEERQHGSRIRLLKARYRHDTRLFANADLTSANLDALIRECKEIASSIAKGAWGRDLTVVKQELAEIEERMGAAHAHALSEGADPSVRTFFEALAQQDLEHRKLLLG
jgi:rubrerythrin